MATVKYTSGVESFKGKLGGTVFQKCGQLQSVRVDVRPRVSLSAKARTARSKFFYLASLWKTLNYQLRAEYNMYANTYPFYDSYGNPLYLNGYQFFIAINTYFNLCASGIVQPVVPYSAPQSYNFGLSNYNIDVHEQYYTGNGNIPADNFLMIYVSLQKGLQSGITHRKYIFAGAVPDTYILGANINAALDPTVTATFIKHQRYWYFIRQFDVSTGCWLDTPASYFDITSAT